MKRRHLLPVVSSFVLNIVLVCLLVILSIGGGSPDESVWTANVHMPTEEVLSGLPDNVHCLVTNHEYFYSTPTDIVFVGDSHTAFFEWGEILPGCDVKNRGVMSDTSAMLLDRVSSITALDPKKIFVLIGTNDLVSPALIALAAGEDPTKVDISANIEAALQNYDAILLELLDGLPDADIYIQSIFPFGARFDYLAEDVQTLNERLQSMCTLYGLTYIDLYRKMADDNGVIKEEYGMSDGIHLNSVGYLVWVKEILFYCN